MEGFKFQILNMNKKTEITLNQKSLSLRNPSQTFPD